MDGRARRSMKSLTATILVLVSVAVASADETYRVEGHDVFQVGARDLRGDIAYVGNQRLSVAKRGSATHYVASVDYLRKDQGAVSHAHGSFASTITASGEQRDELNRDPDYLTVLNQPFSVQLDGGTLRDIARLHGRVPFDFPSPITGAPLHGYLEHGVDAVSNGARVVGVAFAADGPLHGRLPDHPGMMLSGTIRMTGTAYYTSTNAMLRSLDATLTITGNVVDAGSNQPVRIVYRRTLRPASPTEAREALAGAH